MTFVPENLRIIAKDIHETGVPHRETVRTLISWFNAQRRGLWVIVGIRQALKEVDLQTKPNFGYVNIDSEVEFLPVEPSPAEQIAPEASEAGTQIEEGDRIVRGGSVDDPVPRIGMLPSAIQTPVSVSRDAEIREAVTLMLQNDFSQLPVMQ